VTSEEREIDGRTGVLSLGERVVLAARLAAIEHVRQAMVEQGQVERRLEPAVAQAAGEDADALHEFVRNQWRGFFDRAGQTTRKEAA
jgi:hypothetical protein